MRFKTRNLVVMALMVALSAIINTFIDIYVPGINLKLVSFAYLPQAMAAMLYGPFAGMAVGFVADFVSFMLKPLGGYFVGYAVSAMVSNVIFALFLYRHEVTLWRAAAARIAIVFVVIFGLNGIWQILYFGTQAGNFYTGTRVIRNLIQFPFDVLLVTYVGKFVKKIATKYQN